MMTREHIQDALIRIAYGDFSLVKRALNNERTLQGIVEYILAHRLIPSSDKPTNPESL